MGATKDERQTFSANVNEVEILLTANYFTSEKYLGEFVASGRDSVKHLLKASTFARHSTIKQQSVAQLEKPNQTIHLIAIVYTY